MKYGVLAFSYSGFDFEKEIKKKGFYYTNLGDNIQTIATTRLYKQFGIAPDKIIPVDRDDLVNFKSEEKVILIMNGCFTNRNFPISKNIIPLYTGFHTDEKTIITNKEHFKKEEPIGCRDVATDNLFKKHNISSYVSGCLTMTLPKRESTKEKTTTFIIYGSGTGSLPLAVLRHIPNEIIKNAVLKFHRIPRIRHPLSRLDIRENEKYASKLLGLYNKKAKLIITSLHHAATPSIASGIPTIICRQKASDRFSYLETLLPVYTPESFRHIDWNPKSIDIENWKRSISTMLSVKLSLYGD